MSECDIRSRCTCPSSVASRVVPRVCPARAAEVLVGTGRGWQQKSRSCDDNSSPSGTVWPLLPTVPLRHVFGRPRPPTHPNRAMGGRLFDMLGPVVYRAGWTGDFTGFYACRARIAPGQHPWVGLPTMQFECSRMGGQWWVVVVWSPRHRLRRIARRVQVAGAADAASNLKNIMRTPALPHLMFERSKEGWTPCRPCMTCPVDRFRSCVLRATAAWDGTAQWMWRRRSR